MSALPPNTTKLSPKDFATDQDVRWCPGCGDYSILKQVQTVMAEAGLDRDQVAVISGIGCSSRFPYYMETYGMHSIHGRAPAIATGLRIAKPDLSIWLVTGDGDGLSIGGNHLLHVLRRNVNLNVMLFNNQIYGLTKGQYSPTSETNKMTKSSPMGSIDNPVNPLAFALGAGASFVARSMDRDPSHLKAMLHRANDYKGTSFLEIYQNCNIFNDGAFLAFTDRKTKADTALFLEQGQPLVFGQNNDKGIRFDAGRPVVVDLEKDGFSKEDLWVHDETDLWKAQVLARFFDDPNHARDEYFPRPFGVLYAVERPTYEDRLFEQLETAVAQKGTGDLDALIAGNATWEID
ncbi:MAG: 2-oxoacid:ferredoxin oxidoreductase subunit beta [Bacteroidetes bacterium]|nr:MAG: 2-oxoacid:ferredoxin oxidoreductase subunit beta [Bacteroidota bacterium]